MPTACIIGAGSSGIVTAKIFKEQGIDFVCYEKGSAIGGNWRFGNDNGMSSAYRSLHINTSRKLMAYSDFPMPEDYPDYPHHSQILDYFEDYVDHFGIRPHIRFNTEVTKVERLDNGHWLVTLHTGDTEVFEKLVVANGHHWDPRFPEPPLKGNFSGTTLHSHDYKEPGGLAGKNVVILGIGNSAVDIACELARLGGKVSIATRSGAYIVPKYILGFPTDELSKPPLAYAPMFVKRAMLGLSLWLSRGKQSNYGVPTPDRKLLREHPTVSQDLLSLVGHGKVTVRPNISRLDGKEIHFEDGHVELADALIYATGYKISFPFFEPDFLQVRDNRIRLYRHVVHPDLEGLYFIGLIQPLGAIMPLAEVQAEWVARLITGAVALPEPEAMKKAIAKKEKSDRRRYLDRPRHTIQVDFFPYRRRILKEMNRYRQSPPVGKKTPAPAERVS